MKNRLIAVCCLLTPTLLAGQEPRGLQKVETEVAEGPVQLAVQVQAKAGRLLRTLEAGESLESGDFVQFLISVDRPAYLYVVQRFADGTASVLYPEQADVRLQAGLETRIPEAGSWFQLDSAAGEEHVYFVASTRPLAEADAAVYEALQDVREQEPQVAAEPTPSPPPAAATTAAAPPPPKPARPKRVVPAPTTFDLATRGLVKTTQEGTTQVVGDETGVAVYHFWFRHEAKVEP